MTDRVTPWVGVRRYIATGDADDEGNLGGVAITYEERPSRADLVGAPGDIAFARMAATAKVFVMDERASRAVFSTGFAILRPRPERANVHFLKHWLRSSETQLTMDSLSAGATQRALTNAGLGALEMPLPPVSEQQRIAAILDAADAIRAKRRAQLAHLDDLPQAVFRSMFGDPAQARECDKRAIGEVARVVTGNTPPRSDPSNYGDLIEWIKSDNLGGFVATPASERLSSIGRGRARLAPAGSVLVTCIAGSPASIGKASIVDREVAFNQQINAILPSNALEPVFLHAQLAGAPTLIRAKSTGGMKGLVSKSQFESVRILVPRLAVQQEFVAKVEAIHAERARVARALEADDELFAALQHRAFRGEL